MRVLLRKSDNHLLQAQSGDHAPLEPLLAFAESRGYSHDQVEARVMPDAEFAALLAALTESEKTYAQKREYPPIAEQLDLIWHAIDAGQPLDATSDFYKAVAAAKARHPKP